MTHAAPETNSPAKAEAEIRKLNAEALQAEADAEKAAAEASKLKLEAQFAAEENALSLRKKRAEAVIAENNGHQAAITARNAEYGEQLRLVSDYRHNTYWFDDRVDYTSVTDCIRTLRSWHRLDPNADITIIFNSPGGSVIDGMALFDEITTLSLRGGGSHKVTTVIRGYAASMAGILLQAGDVRLSGRESYLMIHEISAGTGGKIGDMIDSVAFFKRLSAHIEDIFIERSGGRVTKEQFLDWRRTDQWIDSTDSLKLGLIDGIG